MFIQFFVFEFELFKKILGVWRYLVPAWCYCWWRNT